MSEVDNQSGPKSKTTYHYIFKIITIGNANTGKTSLINRYVNHTFADNYICTLGVDFCMKTIEIDKTVIKLQLWDTAGMEKFRTIAASYFRGCHAAFVVFDLTSRSSFQGVEQWIEQYNKESSPLFKRMVVLLGNKCDLVDQRAVSEEELDVFIQNNEVLYFPTSAKTGEGVEEVFAAIGKLLFEHYRNASEQTKSSMVVKKVHMEQSSFPLAVKKPEAIQEKKKCC